MSSFRTDAPPRRGRSGTHGATGTGRCKRGASGGFRLRPACGGPVRNDDRREGALATGRPAPHHWLHANRTFEWGDPEAQAIKRAIKRQYYPATDAWKEMVLARSRQVLRQTLEGLERFG